jgi:hypothetical protein
VIITVPGKNIRRNDLVTYFAKKLAASSPNRKYLTMYEYGNVLGLMPLIASEAVGHTPFRELLVKIESGEIEALVLFGEDILGADPGLDKKARRAKFTLLVSYFARETAEDTVVTFPLASQLETNGTFVRADGQELKPEPLVPRIGGRTAQGIAFLLGDETPHLEENALPALQSLPADHQALLDAARRLEPLASYPLANITHFGNNNLVKNFFWYRANNG